MKRHKLIKKLNKRAFKLATARLKIKNLMKEKPDSFAPKLTKDLSPFRSKNLIFHRKPTKKAHYTFRRNIKTTSG
jgi:hypothetical protein